MGGQTRNPHALDRSPCGSSAGSAVAVAAGLAAAAIGTETDGSITFPASVNGVVGMKPTVGLVSRARIIPISNSQDTAGPMARTVRDAALLLSVLADPAVLAEPAPTTLASALTRLPQDALREARIGVLEFASGFHEATDVVFRTALHCIEAAGATLVPIAAFPCDRAVLGNLEMIVLMSELKAGLNAYLATTDARQVATRSLRDVIDFNMTHADDELALFGQDLFEAAERTTGLDDPVYLAARRDGRRMAGAGGIDAMIERYGVTALVAPTLGPAWCIDPILGDHFVGGGSSMAAAIAGYPHLSVPMGQVGGMPVGLSFIGPAWSDALLLAYGAAFEDRANAYRVPLFPTSADYRGLGNASDRTASVPAAGAWTAS